MNNNLTIEQMEKTMMKQMEVERKSHDYGFNIEHLSACVEALKKPTEEEQIKALERICNKENVAYAILHKIDGTYDNYIHACMTDISTCVAPFSLVSFDDGLNIRHLKNCIWALSRKTDKERIAHLEQLARQDNLAHMILIKNFNGRGIL
jgi:hypothetical protein